MRNVFQYPLPVPETGSQDPAVLRDRAVAEADERFACSDIPGLIAALDKLRWATIDEETLAQTDHFLPAIAAGRRIVATCDSGRTPAPDEVVIVYGNYPHFFENVVVNNPIKRHVGGFGEFKYNEVEFDSRWKRIGQIYIINASERMDRYDAVMRELATARAPLDRITRIPAIKERRTGQAQLDGTIGCLRSHIAALRTAKLGGFEHILVLEDDFCFTTDIDVHLNDLETFLTRSYDYYICLLSTSKHGKIVPKDDLISVSLQSCTNAGAYIVSRAGLDRLVPVQEMALRRLLETRDSNRYAADRYWAVLQSSGKFLVFRRKLGFQTSSYSDIERRVCRYLD